MNIIQNVIFVLLGLVVFFYTLNCFFDSLKKARKEHDSPWPDSLIEVSFMALGAAAFVLGFADIRLQSFVQTIVLVLTSISLLAFGILLGREMLPVVHKRVKLVAHKILIRQKIRQYRKKREYEDYIAHTQASTQLTEINRQVSETVIMAQDQNQTPIGDPTNLDSLEGDWARLIVDTNLELYRLEKKAEGSSGRQKTEANQAIKLQEDRRDDIVSRIPALSHAINLWVSQEIERGKAEIDAAYTVITPLVQDEPIPLPFKPIVNQKKEVKETPFEGFITKKTPASDTPKTTSSARRKKSSNP